MIVTVVNLYIKTYLLFTSLTWSYDIMKMKKKVVIVEDDLAFGNDLKQLFENNGFEAIIFNSFDHIDAALKLQNPNVIICDLSFPEGRADKFINQLREDEFFNLTPIVVLTGLDLGDIDIDQLLSTGVSAVFFKPTRFNTFLIAIDKLLNKQKEYVFTEHFIKILRYPLSVFKRQ